LEKLCALWPIVHSSLLRCYQWLAGYENQIWLAPHHTFASWVIERVAILFGLMVLIGLTATSIKLLTRCRLEQNLRFDVYAAVNDSVSQVLARHLPDYQKLTTVIATGEDLLRPAEQMSKRVNKLMLSLQPLVAQLGLAEAINQFVRNALRANDVADTISNIEGILTRIETDGQAGNVVQLEQRPSE
jgi:mannose/fructose/N-acetylgalactosamine-specific phosphotransferase system component IID